MTIKIWVEYSNGDKVFHNTAQTFEEAQQVSEALFRLGYAKVWIELRN